MARSESSRPRPPLLRALGAEDPPVTVKIDGITHERIRIFKHDSWAATALYADLQGTLAVCKFHRRQAILGVRLDWLGKLLARHEADLLRRLADLPNVPRLYGPVTVGGCRLPNAVARAYVSGHPLGQQEAVSDQFFAQLQELLAEMHRRGMAYVDLHKRENILVGEDGRPYLIDFQISVAGPTFWPWNNFAVRTLLEILQRSDDYHLAKHFARCRPDLFGQTTDDVAAHRPWWIRLHRLIAQPLRSARRRLLVAIGVRQGRGRVESEHFIEEGLRAA